MPYYIKRTKAKKKDKPLPLFDKAGVTVKKKPDLKAKLDKEFSLFIRLRDAMPNGYFRCISCDSKDNPQNYKKSDFDYEQLIKYYKALNKKLRKEKGV